MKNTCDPSLIFTIFILVLIFCLNARSDLPPFMAVIIKFNETSQTMYSYQDKVEYSTQTGVITFKGFECVFKNDAQYEFLKLKTDADRLLPIRNMFYHPDSKSFEIELSINAYCKQNQIFKDGME